MFYNTKAGLIHYEVHGPKKALAVVMTHGGGLNKDMFQSQVKALQERYQVITWDLQGHGRSVPLKENLDVVDMADCLVGIMDEAGIDQAVLVGQSLGVFVNHHAALKYPERVAGIVSIGGMPVDKPMSKLELYVFKALMSVSKLLPESLIFQRAAKEKAKTEEARAFFLESMNQMGKTQFLRMLGGQLDACEIKIDSAPPHPLLITHGEHEMPKSLIKANKDWHASVPKSRYYQVPEAGHNANMDNPTAFNQQLEKFSTEVWDGSLTNTANTKEKITAN